MLSQSVPGVQAFTRSFGTATRPAATRHSRCTQAHRVSPHFRELSLSTKTQWQVKSTTSSYFPLFFERRLSLRYPESNLMQTAAASLSDSSYVPQSIAIIIIMLLLLVTALISNLHPVFLPGSLIIPNIEQIPRDACSCHAKGCCPRCSLDWIKWKISDCTSSQLAW